MKRFVLACLLIVSVFFFSNIAAARIATPNSQTIVQPEAQAEPIVVLIQYDPWAMVIGSDSPIFALYDDGTAIYRRGTEHYAVRLDPNELQAFLESLHLDRLGGQNQSYRISNFTDQPSTFIYLKIGSTYSHVSIYGSLDRSEAMSRLSTEVADIYQTLINFEWHGEVPWLPESVEVMIWPYEYAPDESINWPDRWPNTLHPDTGQRGDGYSLYVPAPEYQALRDFLGTRRERGAVLIDGRKWAASVRFPFPKEARWMDVVEE